MTSRQSMENTSSCYLMAGQVCYAVPARSNVVIFGLGYVGVPLACALKERGYSVCGTTRTSERAARLCEQGVQAFPTETSLASDLIQNVYNADQIVSTVGPGQAGDPILDMFGEEILASKVKALNYVSSTSVYGDYNGALVTETSVPNNPSETGQRRLTIEQAWQSLAEKTGTRLNIFRVSAIYGPDRSAVHSLIKIPDIMVRLQQNADMYVSRIHVDDIVAAMAAAIERNDTVHADQLQMPEIFNLADDEPCSVTDIFAYSKDLLHQFGVDVSSNQVQDESVRQVFGPDRDARRSSKRVSNARMKRLLLPQLKYPSYRQGLSAVAKDMFK